jgi:hypothetical protein
LRARPMGPCRSSADSHPADASIARRACLISILLCQ